MIDESFDRTYQAGRADLHQAFATVLKHAGRAMIAPFETLHRIEWEAPWTPRRRARSN